LDTYSIAFVCTGNRFRSALAEAFVRRLTLGLPVTTESFGTLELDDAPPLPEALEIGLWCGIDLSGHRARHLGITSLEKIDLLLGFEDSHVRHAVVDANAPRRRSFMLREFVRLVEGVDPVGDQDVGTRARNVVEQTADLRAGSHGRGAQDGIRDPFGGTRKLYRETAAEIRELSIALAAALFGVTDASGLPAVPLKLARSRRSLWRR